MDATRREPTFIDRGVETGVRYRGTIRAHANSIMAKCAVTNGWFAPLRRGTLGGRSGEAFQAALSLITGIENRTSMPAIGGPRLGGR
jgi:hypothetical protein